MIRVTIQGNAKDLKFVQSGINKFVRFAPVKLRKRIRERMAEPKSGRLYRRKRGEGFVRFHRASAPGEPPATDTGRYSRSLEIIYKSSFEAVLQTSLNYPAILERTRPMWLPVVDELLPELEMDLVRFIENG